MKPVVDLNDYLKRLFDANMVTRVSRPVNPKYELASLAVDYEKRKQGALLFESVKGSSIPVVTNLFSELGRVALAFGIRQDELHNYFSSAMNGRTKPTLVDVGRVHEKEASSLNALPIPENTEHDAGKYLTSVLTAQESGVRILQWARIEVKSARKLGVRVDPGRRLWDVTKNRHKIHAALIIGAPPSVEFAASVRGSTFDKLEMAGSLQGSSVDLVKCKAVNCEVPALSQIVIEGVLDKRNMEPEGPFAEFTGYYSPPEPMPIFKVKKVTMRSDAVFRTVIGASAEHLALNNVGREASLYESLKRAVPGIVDVHLPTFGCGFLAFLSVRKEYVVMAKNALLAALSAHPVIKYAIIVDEDVNIHDEREVLWAMATRSGGDEDLVIVPRAFNHTLDPASIGGFVTKLGIDATFPSDKRELFKRVEYMSLDKFKASSSRNRAHERLVRKEGGRMRRGLQ